MKKHRLGKAMVVGDMILRNTNKFPEKIAVVSDGISMSYQVLNERVNRLANALIVSWTS